MNIYGKLCALLFPFFSLNVKNCDYLPLFDHSSLAASCDGCEHDQQTAGLHGDDRPLHEHAHAYGHGHDHDPPREDGDDDVPGLPGGYQRSLKSTFFDFFKTAWCSVSEAIIS